MKKHEKTYAHVFLMMHDNGIAWHFQKRTASNYVPKLPPISAIGCSLETGPRGEPVLRPGHSHALGRHGLCLIPAWTSSLSLISLEDGSLRAASQNNPCFVRKQHTQNHWFSSCVCYSPQKTRNKTHKSFKWLWFISYEVFFTASANPIFISQTWQPLFSQNAIKLNCFTNEAIVRLQKHHPTRWMIKHRTNASAQSCTQGVTTQWISPDSKVPRITQERNIIWGLLTCYVSWFLWLFICMNSHKDVDGGSFPKRCHLISCFQWKPSILVHQSLSSSVTLMDDVMQ